MAAFTGTASQCRSMSSIPVSLSSQADDSKLSPRAQSTHSVSQVGTSKQETRSVEGCRSGHNRVFKFEQGSFHEGWGREELQRCRKGHRKDGQLRRKSKACGPICLLPGVGSGFWEGADSDSSSSERFQPRRGPFRKAQERSVLLSLIQEVEPLDVSHISKDASVNSMDAMKRTISGMLGLLPSDQFLVSIEMEREPLARLLVSAMMTGYTLRNAEYRLSLQRTLDRCEESGTECGLEEGQPAGRPDREQASLGRDAEGNDQITDSVAERTECSGRNGKEVVAPAFERPAGLGELSPEAAAYIQQLQSRLAATSQELDNCKRTLAELEVDNMVADDENDLLDYLRSLDSEKVAELSQPTSPEVEEVIQQVIDRLLGSLSPTRSPLGPPLGSSPSASSSNNSSISRPWDHETETDTAGNVPLQFQSTVTASRDYLARLLFWCMLLGHYMRALEYRLELSRTFSLHSDVSL